MILNNDKYGKPQRVLLSPILISKRFTQEQALHQFKQFMDKWFHYDYFICCKPFKRSDGEWCIYIQTNHPKNNTLRRRN